MNETTLVRKEIRICIKNLDQTQKYVFFILKYMLSSLNTCLEGKMRVKFLTVLASK